MIAALALIPLAAAEHPPGATLPDAAIVDITTPGLNAFVPIAQTLVPPQFDIPALGGADEGGCVFGFCAYEYAYGIADGWVSVGIGSVSITPVAAAAGVARLDVSAALTAQINQPSDPVALDIYAQAIGFITVDEQCDAWVDPFQIQVDGTITLQIVQTPDGPALDAAISGLDQWTWTLTSDDISLTNCGTISTIESILDFVGVDVFELLLDFAEPEIRGAISDLVADIEAPLEDAFQSAVLYEELDLAGIPLTIDVYPSQVQSTAAGLRLTLAGSIDAPPHPCVEPYGITGSLATVSSPDGVGVIPSGLGFTPHVAVQADDDLLNQGLFALWNGGLFCQTLDSGFEGLPIPLDTSLLGLIAPGVYDDLFPETRPIAIVTRPTLPPLGTTSGPSDLNVVVDGLGIDLTAELDGRLARVLALDLAVDVGADLVFDGATGALAVEVDLSGDNLTPTVTFNEFTADANAQIEDQFRGLFDTLAGPLLGGVLDDLAFSIPSFSGYGLTQAVIRPAASTGDRLGVYGQVGAVPYDSGGCDGGCDAGSGCSDASCSTAGGGRAVLLAFPLVLALLRRRR